MSNLILLTLQAKFVFSIPYTAQYLPACLEYPVHMWVNTEKNLFRLDVNSNDNVAGVNTWGLDSSIKKDVRHPLSRTTP